MIIVKILREFTFFIFMGLSSFVMLCAAVGLYLIPDLPPVEEIRDMPMEIPLRIFSRNGDLIAEYGNERRQPVRFEQIPNDFVKALTAIEDSRFEEHFGMDPIGFSRAALGFVRGVNAGGGSTLTQQVARNFFLNQEQTFTRKFTEILLALQLERELSKAEIFELYANKHFLGHRAYGIQAAARVYFGRDLSELSLAELALLAGLHQAPSAANPFTNPERAQRRRNQVLDRMLELDYISEQRHAAARQEPIRSQRPRAQNSLEASYVGEMVRLQLLEEYSEEQIYSLGLTVHTSIDSQQQLAANLALRNGLLDYSERHGFFGPEDSIDLGSSSDSDVRLALESIPTAANLSNAMVLEVGSSNFLAQTREHGLVEVSEAGWRWARRYNTANSMGPRPDRPGQVVQPGDVVRLRQTEDGWRLSQVPRVQGALVAMDPQTGAVRALVGGYDYRINQFNRVLRAERQPGSTIKPFIFAAALEQGWSAGSIVNDAPIIFADESLADGVWRPRNTGDRYLGPITVRQALYQSRNAAAVRILDDIGILYTIDFLTRFGFDRNAINPGYSLVLGSNVTTPIDLNRAIATFANQGHLVDAWLIERVEDAQGNLRYQQDHPRACRDCANPAPTTIEPRTAFVMDSMLRDVISTGTGTGARSLNRSDVAGKTGSTNDNFDAWFSGYQPSLAATVWVGFDNPQTLGNGEFGGRAALPIWTQFMTSALTNVDEEPLSMPAGVTQVRIDRTNGRASSGANSYQELFFEERVPPRSQTTDQGINLDDSSDPSSIF